MLGFSWSREAQSPTVLRFSLRWTDTDVSSHWSQSDAVLVSLDLREGAAMKTGAWSRGALAELDWLARLVASAAAYRKVKRCIDTSRVGEGKALIDVVIFRTRT